MRNKSTVVLLLTLWVTGTVWVTGTAVAQPDCDMRGGPAPERGMNHCRMMAPQGAGCEMSGHSMKRDRGAGMKALLRYAEELNLSDSQKKQLENSKFEFQMARIDLEAAIKKAKIRLKRLKRDDQAAESEVMEAIDMAAGAKAEMEKLRYSHRRKTLASLTEEQRAKLRELRMEQRCGNDEVEINVEVEKKMRKRRKSHSRFGG